MSHQERAELRSAKIDASHLLKELQGKDAAKSREAALRFIEHHPYMQDHTVEDLLRKKQEVQRKHALCVIARERGHADWPALKAAVKSASPAELHYGKQPAFLLPVRSDLEDVLVGAALVWATPESRARFREVVAAASLLSGGAVVTVRGPEPDAFIDTANMSEALTDRLYDCYDDSIYVDDASHLAILDNGDPDYPAGLTDLGRVRAIDLHCRGTWLSFTGIASWGDNDEDTRVQLGGFFFEDMPGGSGKPKSEPGLSGKALTPEIDEAGRLEDCPCGSVFIPSEGCPNADCVFRVVPASGSEEVDRVIERLSKRLRGEIDSLQIESAQEADERAAELAGECGYDIDSDEYEAVMVALCQIAGEEMPGDWEDYPVDAASHEPEPDSANDAASPPLYGVHSGVYIPPSVLRALPQAARELLHAVEGEAYGRVNDKGQILVIYARDGDGFGCMERGYSTEDEQGRGTVDIHAPGAWFDRRGHLLTDPALIAALERYWEMDKLP